MDSIESLGIFWLPGNTPEQGLGGRLLFDPRKGANLALIGQFGEVGDLFRAMSQPSEPLAMHGFLGDKPVTLIGCYQTEGKMRSRGVVESSYLVNSIFRGAHLSAVDLLFQKAYLRTSGGGDWVGKRVLSNSDEQERPAPSSLWLNYSDPLKDSAIFSSGEVEVSYAWAESGTGSVHKVEFEHWPVFSIKYKIQTEFDVIREQVARMEDLLTMCADQVSCVEEIAFQRPDFLVRMASGEDGPYEQEIEYIAPLVDVKTWEPRRADKMLLTYDELGGIETIAKWLDVVPTFTRSLNSLMSVKRAGRMYGENRFLNVAFATEAFHRDVNGGESMPPAEFDELRLACLDAVDNDRKQWLDQRLRYANEPTLKTRLRAMFERMGSSSLPFIEYPNRWVNVVAGVRNALTHLDSRQAGFDGGDLYYLSESLFALTRACMLAELGITGEKIAAKSASHPFSWYAARLNAAVEQLRRVI